MALLSFEHTRSGSQVYLHGWNMFINCNCMKFAWFVEAKRKKSDQEVLHC